jgi:hypothetical protein
VPPAGAGGVSGARPDQLIAPSPAGADAEADLSPGGYELPNLRTVIPVVANVAASYDWSRNITLGGQRSYDPDAPYNNGATWGTFTWDWREESGDWRFFFIDVADVADTAEHSHWLYRTTWTDDAPASADIDTRVYGPASDRFSNPDDPANQDEDMSDPSWYGPYTLDLIGESPYLVQNGSVWPFNTSSGGNEDWVSAPIGGSGLHEVMLDNVLFSGQGFDLPFETEVGSVGLSTDDVQVVGGQCTPFTLTPTLGLTDLTVRAFGVSAPQVFQAVVAAQDDPNNATTSSFKQDVTLPTDAGRFVVTLDGEDDDDLDLYVLYDANEDGQFDYPGEVVGESAGGTADERVEVPGFPSAGAYQVWVFGYAVNGVASTFDLTIDVASGDSLQVRNAPTAAPAGQTTAFDVCADLTKLEGEDGPASGLLVVGPAAAPSLLQVPVTWVRQQ